VGVTFKRGEAQEVGNKFTCIFDAQVTVHRDVFL
jgi:hypothetical protein